MKSEEVPGKIKAFNEGRLPELLKLKYRAMREDKYRFFRAVPHLFYEDIHESSPLRSSPDIWLCGDLHLENLGSYKGDNRVAYFSINDFDECCLGPCMFDVSRMLTSIYMATSNLEIDVKTAHNLCYLFINTYFNALAEGYIRVLENETARGTIKKFLDKVKDRKRKTLIKKRAVKKKGELKIAIDNEHTLPVSDADRRIVTSHIHEWAKQKSNPEFFTVMDVAFRIAGTSSLGLKRYIVLIEGRGGMNGHFFLDLKETLPSCAAKFINVPQPKWPTEADRQVEVQKRVLSDPPALLASINIKDKNYVLKELQPLADRIDYTLFHGNTKKLQNVIESMANVCAWSALRSSGRQGSAIADELIYFAKTSKSLKKAVMDLAYAYSITLDSYYKSYCTAYDKAYFKV